MAETPRCPVTVDEIEDFFFKAMVSSSWASDGQCVEIELGDLYKHKEFSFYGDGFWMVDRFCGNDYCSQSFGTTSILVWDGDLQKWQPVWAMQYSGWYEKEAVPFLKLALMENYAKRIFHGGRGPRDFEIDDCQFQYSCVSHRGYIGDLVRGRGTSFNRFWGNEGIRDNDNGGRIVGEYQFSGQILLPR